MEKLYVKAWLLVANVSSLLFEVIGQNLHLRLIKKYCNNCDPWKHLLNYELQPCIQVTFDYRSLSHYYVFAMRYPGIVLVLPNKISEDFERALKPYFAIEKHLLETWLEVFTKKKRFWVGSCELVYFFSKCGNIRLNIIFGFRPRQSLLPPQATR